MPNWNVSAAVTLCKDQSQGQRDPQFHWGHCSTSSPARPWEAPGEVKLGLKTQGLFGLNRKLGERDTAACGPASPPAPFWMVSSHGRGQEGPEEDSPLPTGEMPSGFREPQHL